MRPVVFSVIVAFVLAGCGPSEALKRAKTPAEASEASPQYAAGWAAFQKNDFTTALRQWLPLARQGVAKAQVSVGQIYDFSLTPPEYEKAVSWYRKASEQGDPQGQANLGIMYMAGFGVPQDYQLAHMWLNLAASGLSDPRDSSAAANNRDIVQANMTPAQIAEGQALARKCQASNFKRCG